MHVKLSCTSLKVPTESSQATRQDAHWYNMSQCLCCGLVFLGFNNHVQCAQEEIGTVLGTSRLEVEVRAVLQQDRGEGWNAASRSCAHYHVKDVGIEPASWVELKDCIRTWANVVEVLDVLSDSDQDCPNLHGLFCTMHTKGFTHAILKPGVAREVQ